jgi:hypothetical protein
MIMIIMFSSDRLFGCGSCVEWVVLYRMADTVVDYAETQTALGIVLESSELQLLQEPFQQSETVSDWVTHKKKLDSCSAAAETSGGVTWEDAVQGCGWVASMNPVVFVKGSRPTTWLVYEQVDTRINPTVMGEHPCDKAHVQKGTTLPTGTWECQGR